MSPLSTPSRQVLTELAATFLSGTEALIHGASPVRRTFATLTALLDAQVIALAKVDRIEAELTAQTGHPRVTLPVLPGSAPSYAADAVTIRRLLGDGPVARRLADVLRRRQQRFVQAAETAGLPAAQAYERTLAIEIGDVTAALLLAPTTDFDDHAHKLVVLVAFYEPGPPDATTSPGAYLRTLLTDIIKLAKAKNANF
ncbi:hypothetical protein MKK69_08155 [Methylobacterium sp. J-026]|uniref:hypothetical protein n=1 Tax=Methylobacterium sp. J-026 TaxID=2836624 RepID=UPI001FB9B697|nr:hypothetical protein [Methylobacterium sp. J-026]MCJ2134038.1 hypothetical protein [Methylobacterium sp. J-026]